MWPLAQEYLKRDSSKWLLFLVFVLQFAITWAITTYFSFFSEKRPSAYVLTVFIQVFSILLPALVYAWLKADSFKKTFKFQPIGKMAILHCVIIGICAQIIATIINIPALWALSYLPPSVSAASFTPPESIASLLLGLAIISLLPSICEELLMRGAVLSSLNPKTAIYLTTVCFTIMHNNLGGFLGLMLLGYLLARLTLSTESILAAMIIHFSHNAFGMIFQYIIDETALSMPFLGGYLFRILLFIISVALIFWILPRYKSKGENDIKISLSEFLNFPIILMILGFIAFQTTLILKG